MRKIANSIISRSCLATVLGLSFLTYLPLRVSAGAAFRTAVDTKSESQFRSEAARYDGAIRAVTGITTMKLETAEDLKEAVAILERELPNLKLLFSKLVVLAASDSTFARGVKKQISDKPTAERLAKEWKADPKTILKLDGTQTLGSQLQRSIEADAALFRRAAERLQQAVKKIKSVGQASPPPIGFKLERVGLNVKEPAGAPTAETYPSASLIGPGLIIVAVIVVIEVIIMVNLFLIVVDPEPPREVQTFFDCTRAAGERYVTCMVRANIFTMADCVAQQLLDYAICALQAI